MNEISIILSSVTTILLVVVVFILLKNKQQNNDEDNTELKAFFKEENSKLKDIFKDENIELRLKLAEFINQSSKSSMKDLNEFKDSLYKQILDRFNTLSRTLNDQMDGINKKVEIRLNEGFEKTNKTFENIVARLSKIDEAQKNIEKLSTDVVSLQEVLTDKKTRGTFGEVQLNNILESIFGEGNDKIYELQYKFSNGKLADAVLHVPEPMGDLAIDSKFPLENYQRMVDREASEYEKAEAKKKFKTDLKKHISDIEEKYIIPNETAEQAVMFIPAEAIFAEINAYHPDIITFSQKKHVWIASPTTIMSLLTTVQVIIQNVDRNKNMKVIHNELNKLGEEFGRYRKRWDSLAKDINKVSKDVDMIYTTSDKIEKRFNAIKLVEFDEVENDESTQIEENIEQVIKESE